MGFAKMGLNPSIQKALTEMGFSKPTPIQEQGIPLLLQGEDIIGQAQTGTGKTAAFGICILERLAAAPQHGHAHASGRTGQHEQHGHDSHAQAPAGFQQGSHPHEHQRKVRALILAPTRELAVQITGEIQKIGKYLAVRTLAVYGGQEIEKQLSPLHAGVDIVVGTPGRLLDHIERGTLQLGAVEVVVLDEADRMLDMGFIEDIEKILHKTPQGRQTLLFSATMPAEIMGLGQKYLKSPQQVRVSEDSLSVKNIRQYYIEVSKFDRLNALLILLAQKQPSLALIFVRTKRGADRLNEILLDRGFHSLALHGDMSQNKRDRSMDAFRKKHINILVATDLASRGLDVTDVSHVINFDTTDDPYTYVHRIGRTGRMGKDGSAISFVFFDQSSLVGILEKVTDSRIEQIKMEIKPELLPKRVRFTEHPSEGRFGARRGEEGRRFGGEGRGRFGSFSGSGRGSGGHGSFGRAGSDSRHPREGGSGGRRDSRGRGRDSRRREGSERRDVSSRGHQYFGRRS